MIYRRKLIEVALPLEVINKASAREKSIRHGHPSTLHLWWVRWPLAACRAVLFARMNGHRVHYMCRSSQCELDSGVTSVNHDFRALLTRGKLSA